MNSTEHPTVSASCSCVSFLTLRRLAIRWPSFRLSTEFNYHNGDQLSTQLNYGSIVGVNDEVSRCASTLG